jgi:hypothetical protein
MNLEPIVSNAFYRYLNRTFPHEDQHFVRELTTVRAEIALARQNFMESPQEQLGQAAANLCEATARAHTLYGVVLYVRRARHTQPHLEYLEHANFYARQAQQLRIETQR